MLVSCGKIAKVFFSFDRFAFSIFSEVMAYNSVAGAGGIVTNVPGNEVQTESQIKLQNFWELEKVDVEDMKPKQVIATISLINGVCSVLKLLRTCITNFTFRTLKE